KTLSESTFSGWNMFESALATLLNGGRNSGRFYLVNGHFVDYNERGLISFCSKDPEIGDAQAVGRFFYEKLEAYMTFVSGLKKAAPDNVELLTLWQLFVAQNRKFSNFDLTMSSSRQIAPYSNVRRHASCSSIAFSPTCTSTTRRRTEITQIECRGFRLCSSNS
ncbi:hypothetical protein AAVH_15906, partial [Aphelenchoides avenae]